MAIAALSIAIAMVFGSKYQVEYKRSTQLEKELQQIKIELEWVDSIVSQLESERKTLLRVPVVKSWFPGMWFQLTLNPRAQAIYYRAVRVKEGAIYDFETDSLLSRE